MSEQAEALPPSIDLQPPASSSLLATVEGQINEPATTSLLSSQPEAELTLPVLPEAETSANSLSTIFPPVETAKMLRVLEAALLTTQEPLSLAELKKLFDMPLENAFIEQLLQQLEQQYAHSGVELNRVANGWRFRARPEMQCYLDRLNPQRPPRYSRAVMETLAIIAYRQPVTRGDIEEIRGVAVSSQILKTLEARSWIDVVGTRDAPGKPSLYATTKQLLDDLNLRSLQELPSLDEMGNLLEQDTALGVTGTP